MAKLRHIALAAEDPYTTAEFYKQAFDFVEVRRTEPRGEGTSYGVFLSDGTISLAILRFGWDQGHGLDYRGIHHLACWSTMSSPISRSWRSWARNVSHGARPR